MFHFVFALLYLLLLVFYWIFYAGFTSLQNYTNQYKFNEFSPNRAVQGTEWRKCITERKYITMSDYSNIVQPQYIFYLFWNVTVITYCIILVCLWMSEPIVHGLHMKIAVNTDIAKPLIWCYANGFCKLTPIIKSRVKNCSVSHLRLTSCLSKYCIKWTRHLQMCWNAALLPLWYCFILNK